jgi:hypothetical protein
MGYAMGYALSNVPKRFCFVFIVLNFDFFRTTTKSAAQHNLWANAGAQIFTSYCIHLSNIYICFK